MPIGPEGYPSTWISGSHYDQILLNFELKPEWQSGVPLTPGTFDLASAPDNDPQNCQHCVHATFNSNQVFVATAGTMILETVNVDAPYSKGSVLGVTLREYDQFAMSMVPNGGCYRIDSIAWNHVPEPGIGCVNRADCNNVYLEGCDPSSLTCVKSDCASCSDAETCVLGVCLPKCNSKESSACPEGMSCALLQQYGPTDMCLPVGQAGAGEPCVSTDTSTGCQQGMVCTTSGICAKGCSVFRDPTLNDCPCDHTCSSRGYCSSSPGNQAGINENCKGDTWHEKCGLEGATYRGSCEWTIDNSALRCYGLCRTASDCTAAEACENGLCKPWDEYCAIRTPLSLGEHEIYLTDSGAIQGTCGASFYSGIFSFVAPSAGALHVSATGEIDMVLSSLFVQDSCGDPATHELACVGDGQSAQSLSIDVPLSAGQNVTVGMSGYGSSSNAVMITASFN